MNKRKEYAQNKLFTLCFLLGLFFAWGSVEFFIENDNASGLGVGAVALLLMVLPAIFTPYCYAFDAEGVSLCYIFLPVERYLWKDICSIEVKFTNSSSRSAIFQLFYASVFCIDGDNVGKTRFYMNGHIRKSFKTKRLLEKYWDGTITGYLFEDVKSLINNKKNKKQSQIKAHLTDEIVVMEREIRAQAREWLKPFTTQAKQYDLDIKVKYVYITKDLKELNSRPNEGYIYTLVADISHFGETDENRIAVVSVDLLYVRLGKTAYRGVENKHIKEDFEFTFSDTLNEIKENGIEVYCENN